MKHLRVFALAVLAGCGSAGLPPAGPPPGQADIGYGSQPAANVTGRVTTITEEQIRKSSAQTVTELLRRRQIAVPGLVVIDGVQSRDRSVMEVFHPNEIRQIDVLRDLSASNIYGLAGRNGVLIITTKR